MILSDTSIHQELGSGGLETYPLRNTKQVQPASIDLRLGRSFSMIDPQTKLLTMDSPATYINVLADEFTLLPQTFILATTVEKVKIPNYLTGFFEGRSSVGRMGLSVQNAGYIDPGFEGEITLELFNATQTPIKLIAGRRIGQLVLSTLTTPCANPYAGKYQNQKGATPSKLFEDEEVVK